MKSHTMLLIGFIVIFNSCKSEVTKPGNQWHQGGSLHKSKVTEWKKATERNKLATCGDFCAKIYKNNSLEEIKIIATNLKICINEAVKEHNGFDNYEVAGIASMCLILLEN